MFAWEWLRRCGAYRRSWTRARGADVAHQARVARRFGLVELVPPSLSAADARPIWRAECDPFVILATPVAGAAAADDRLDIRRLSALAAFGSAGDDIEHWRIGDAAHSVRLDLWQGTLLGGPTLLRYHLCGLARIRKSVAALDGLIRLALAAPPRLAAAREARSDRWIAELRTADALAAGATQQEIARALFGAAIPATGWRGEGDSFRYRVQRLVRAAKARLADPLSDIWFR